VLFNLLLLGRKGVNLVAEGGLAIVTNLNNLVKDIKNSIKLANDVLRGVIKLVRKDYIVVIVVN
jgi:hypothetical protein